MTNSSGPPESVQVITGFCGQHGFQRDVAVVFIHGRKEDSQAAGVKFALLLLGYRSQPLHPVRAAVFLCERDALPLESRFIR